MVHLENYRRHWGDHKNSPKFQFPTTTEHPHHTETNPIDEVIKNVKKVVTEVASSITTSEKPCEITTVLSETTTPMIDITQNTNSSITDIVVNTNNTMINEMMDSNRTMVDIAINTNNTMLNEMMNTNKSMIDIGSDMNNTMLNASVTEMSNVVNVTLTSLNNTGGDEMITTEQATTLQDVSSQATKVFDWVSDGTNEFINHNLTMTHDGDTNENSQTLYIILGVILGVLVAIALILFLIYLSYKRSNFYTLQEQASCTSSRVVNNTTVQYSKDPEEPNDICSNLE